MTNSIKTPTSRTPLILAIASPLLLALVLGAFQQPLLERAAVQGRALSVPAMFFLQRTFTQWCLFGVVMAGIGGLGGRRLQFGAIALTIVVAVMYVLFVVL